LGTRGRQKVRQQYTWPQVARRTLAQYEQLLQTRS
jgi:hypothetical protein